MQMSVQSSTLVIHSYCINVNNQLIKQATEPNILGFEWSDEIIDVADTLYHQQIPKCWCTLSGSTVNFAMFYSLASFINDVGVRYQHIDRCLSLVNCSCFLLVFCFLYV